MEKEVFKLKVKIDIPDLDKFDSYPDNEPCILKYDAELILDIDNNHDVLLKIYFNPNEALEYKVINYSKLEYEVKDSLKRESFLDKIEFIDNLEPLFNGIDFNGFRYKSITTNKADNACSLDIKTTGVNLKFAVVEPRDSVFYLNKESFTLIEPNFYYKPNFSWQKKDYKWEAIPKIKNFLTFNAVHYKPDFGIHNTNSSKEQVTITKEPIIKFLFNGLGKDEIKKHINAICALLSFFSGRDINYQFSKIYDGNGEFVEVKNIPNTYSDYYHGMFMYEIRNPFNLIASVNAPFFILNIEFITNCIRRFNTALQLEGESKFMLLYNVIEQIRNHYVETNKTSNNYKVVDSYQFNDENSATEIIKKSLNEISEFVKLELKSSFISEIPNKTKDIKRLTMKNQFNSLFIHLKIDPENYMIDFKALFSLRNEIFHGNPVSDIEMLNKVNNFQCLPKFTGMLMLKFMGVNSLKDIKKVAN